MIKDTSLLICGDVVVTDGNKKLFADPELIQLLGEELFDLIMRSKRVLINLEAPLTHRDESILKCGEPLKSNPSAVRGLSQLGKVTASLANNHIMDYGEPGLLDTMSLLSENGIDFFGAGLEATAASDHIILDIDGVKFCITAFAEHEFSIARNGLVGANPYDALTSYDRIKELGDDADFLVVLYHGGKEYYRYPSPDLQKVCRKFIDSGADLVVCQHSHCIGCQERYESGCIVYGQGNFIFDGDDGGCWASSLLLRCTVNDSGLSINYVPIVKNGPSVRLATEGESKQIMRDFYERSEEIKEPGFIARQYDLFAMDYIDGYLRDFFPVNDCVVVRGLNKLLHGHFPRNLMKGQQLVNILNRVECEAHRELFIRGLELTSGLVGGPRDGR